ncbi:hypothetical protein MCEMSE6_02569 [Oxalobacteraceae bacterium]|jgi:hypothetical protein
MWKILVAFIIFAAISLTLVFKMGDKVDMQGEAGGQAEHAAPATAPAAATAPAESPAAAAPAVTATEEKK